jgi:hypothetical protein
MAHTFNMRNLFKNGVRELTSHVNHFFSVIFSIKMVYLHLLSIIAAAASPIKKINTNDFYCDCGNLGSLRGTHAEPVAYIFRFCFCAWKLTSSLNLYSQQALKEVLLSIKGS